MYTNNIWKQKLKYLLSGKITNQNYPMILNIWILFNQQTIFIIFFLSNEKNKIPRYQIKRIVKKKNLRSITTMTWESVIS